jgi:hypothetical protein
MYTKIIRNVQKQEQRKYVNYDRINIRFLTN